MSSEEIKADYTSSLSDLTSNSKPLINVLTMLAEENILHAPDIVTAIEEHLSKVQTDVKLPILYLVDSVVKNLGGNYTELFSQNLVKTFCTVFKAVDEKTRAEMFKLRQTWNDIFPQQKLYAIDVQINRLMDPAWPVTAKPPSNRIHLNPKFLNSSSSPSTSSSSSSATAFNKSKPEPKELEVAVEAIEDASIMDPDTFAMQQKLIQKQKELIELHQKKLELELLQTKVKLQNQLKNTRQPAGAPQSAPNILLKPEVAKQLVPGAVRVGTKLKAPPMGANQRSGALGAKVTPVNSALVAAGSKPIRDPRLLRQQAEKAVNNGAVASVGPKPVGNKGTGKILGAKSPKSDAILSPVKAKLSPVKARDKFSKSRTSSSKSSSSSDSPVKSKSSGDSSNKSPTKSPTTGRHKKSKEYYSDGKTKSGGKQREREGKGHKVEISPTAFKGVKGTTKNRNYIRRNRSRSYSPENQDVDFRKLNDNNKSDDGTNKVIMDVDLRQLPSVVGKKRPSTEGLEMSAPKKNKTEVFDVLFGNEDTDLRKLPPVVAERPPTPPPPIISQEDKEKESTKSSNFEFVRAKLANATGRDKIMAKSFRKKRPPSDDDLRPGQQTSLASDTMKKIIITPDDERIIKEGTMTKEQEKQLMNKIIAQIEHQKLKEAQRRDSEDSIRGGLQSVSDDDLDVADEDGKFGDKDDRLSFPNKYNQPQGGRRGGPFWRGAKRRHWDPHHPAQTAAPPMGHARGAGNPRPWMKQQHPPVNPWRPLGPNFARPHHQQQPQFLSELDGRKSPEIPGDLVVDSANCDNSKTINIDGVPRDIRNYDETTIVFMSWDDPREISFQNGTRRVSFDDKEIYLLSFNEGYKEISVKGSVHKVRLGAPSRELFVDGRPYECYFGGPGVTVELDGRMVAVKLDGPPPEVKIGTQRRSDLVAGKVNLIIDAKILVPVYLDGTVQKFALDGETYTLKFVDALKTVLINDVALDVEFGGLPKPIIVHDKKHFIRFPVLPRGVKPGCVDIKDMEGSGRVFTASSSGSANNNAVDENSQDAATHGYGGVHNEPALPVFGRTRNKRVEDDAERNSNSPHSFQSFMQRSNFDMLSSVMTNSLAPSTSSGGYQVENQPDGAVNRMTEMSSANPNNGGNPPSLPASLNINDLFQKLVATGIVATSGNNKNQSAADEASKTAKRNVLQSLKAVTFRKPETLKVRHGALYDVLYSGMQCSSCGMRFPPEQSSHYSQHLDWHFRQNRKGKRNIRVAASRRWYYSLSDWKNFEEIEDLEEREKNYFDQQQSQAEGAGEDGDEDAEIPSVLADPDVQEARCDVCQDKFDQFFNEEREEWHLRNAVRVEDRTYHPVCYEDFKTSLLDETKEEPPQEELVESKPEERGIPGLEIILDDDEEDEVMTAENDEEADKKVVIEESDESKLSATETKDGEKSEEVEEREDDGEDDDVILNEVAPEKIEVDDDDDYKDYTSCDAAIMPHQVKVEQIDDGFMDIEEGLLKINNGGQIKIKSEPVDSDEHEMAAEQVVESPKPAVDTTRAGLISSMDGNTQLTGAGIIPASSGHVTGKIRINISKPLPAVAPRESKDAHCDNSSVPEPVIDPSQPPPPGEEPPVQLHVKPALLGLELKKVPAVRKGSELTGMCSIM